MSIYNLFAFAIFAVNTAAAAAVVLVVVVVVVVIYNYVPEQKTFVKHLNFMLQA